MDSTPEGVTYEERLTFDEVEAPSLTASEHLHRYEWAAGMVAGCRVLDLCCGIGYGSLVLARSASAVHGVDYAPEAVEAARRQAGSREDVTFAVGDAVDVLQRDLGEDFDAIVCFEGLEHLPRLDEVRERLAHHARNGVRLVLSIPNSRTYGEDNPFHLTDFDFDSAAAFFAALPEARVWYQHLAEGSLIVDEQGRPAGDAEVVLPDRAEPPYANNFLATVNVPPDAVSAAATANARLVLAPYYNRELRNMRLENQTLWETNLRIDRQLSEISTQLFREEPPLTALRKSDTAASGRVNSLEEAAAQAKELGARVEQQDARIEELEAAVADLDRLRTQLTAALEYEQAVTADFKERYRLLRERKVVRLGLGASNLRAAARRKD